MAELQTLFFDWGGVIADDPGDDFLKKLLRSIGANDQQVQEIYDSYMRRFMCGQISEAQYWDELRQKYGFEIHESISEDFKQWRGLIVNEQVVALADQAKAKGLKTAILSNIIEPTYNVLAQTGYFERFDQMIASFQVGYAKPQPEIYHIALERLQTTAEQSLFIDDKPKNLQAAEQLGFKTILAENPAQIINDVSEYLR
jgi:epoxide hydrolase-like predicted phosphatase